MDVHSASLNMPEPSNEGVTKYVDLCSVSLLYEDIVQKWKYVLQRRFEAGRELGEETMKIVSDDGPSYDNSVNELRKVFYRGKFMKISSSTFN